MDIGGWLRSLGLGEYEDKFRENRIDAEVLPQLTVDDLKDIGVSTVGDRRKLIAAIAALAGATPPAEVPAAPPQSEPPSRARSAAERRPITVMFCDLVGSTSLAAKMDAEDWRDLVNAYLDSASAAVTGLGGHVLKKLGDGLMALFGYPHAQENDAERAVRAALAILWALEELNARNEGRGLPKLVARIGLDTGPVVVDGIGEVFGEAPNVAARAQAAAEPDGILITAAVQRHIAGLFVAEDKGPQELKGVPAPVTLYRVVRASGGGRRGGARALTPFVGCEEDLALLLRRWERARGGEGQFVQIVGEPGLGKSRLVEEFRSRLGATPHTWVEWASSQLLQNTPLHPLAEWGRLRFGGPDVAPDRRLADLEATLAQVKLDASEHAPLLAPLVDIPVPEARAPRLAPEELRRRQLAAVTAWILAGARAQPIVLAFEDLHWADPTMLDLLKTLVERGAIAPLLILATARPEFRAPWATRSHHGVVSLVPLDRGEIRRMVGAIAERHALSNDSIEGVADRTGGVPLFVEEVTRLLLERGDAGGTQAIPPTLQQSLAARLDRLGEAREVAQIGAVLGREFSYALLRSVAASPVAAVADRGGGLSDLALQSALDKLAEADLLFVEGHAPEATYRFKHALIQDAAYESLLKSRRQALHRRAAEALLGAPDHEPELVAHHFTQAGETELAIEWWGKAGDAALRRSAFQEAIAHLGKAIAMADKEAAPRQQEAAPARTDIHANYARALQVARGYTAPATEAAYDRVAEASALRATDPEHWLVLYGRWTRRFVAAELRAALEDAESQLREAETAKLPMHIAIAHRMIALTRYQLGSFAQARDHAERAIANHDERWAESASAEMGVDHLCTAEAYLAASLWALDKAEMAADLMQRAERRAEDIGQPLSLAHVLTMKNLMLCFANRPKAVLRAAEALRDVVAAHGIGAWEQFARLFLAWARGLQTDARAHAREAQAAASALREQGARLFGEDTRLLAELEAAAGATDAALALFAQGLDCAQRQERGLALPSLHRLRGDILFARNIAAAEDAYRESIRIAREQGARSFVLLAALPLAKLLQTNNRLLDAHVVLAPALEGFEPTPEMPKIAEAQGLLVALEASEAVAAELHKRETRSKLHAGYALASMMTKGFGAEETRVALARAASASGAARTPEYWIVLYGHLNAEMMNGDLSSARAGVEAFLSEAEAAGLPGHAACARRMIGFLKFLGGEYAGARVDIERALADYDERRDESLRTLFGVDFRSNALAHLGHVAWYLGDVEEAGRLTDEAVRRAKELAQTGSVANALYNRLAIGVVCGRAEAVLPAADEMHALADAHELKFWRAIGSTYGDWARVRLGEPRADAFRAGLGVYADLGARMQEVVVQALLADVELFVGQQDKALAAVDRGLAFAAEFGLGLMRPWLLRLRGQALAETDPAGAASAYREALSVAGADGSRPLALLAALPLAKLYQSSGRPAEARAVLAPTLEGFAPTPEMPQIAEAEALLSQLH